LQAEEEKESAMTLVDEKQHNLMTKPKSSAGPT
jgi:hypothetical protein